MLQVLGSSLLIGGCVLMIFILGPVVPKFVFWVMLIVCAPVILTLVGALAGCVWGWIDTLDTDNY